MFNICFSTEKKLNLHVMKRKVYILFICLLTLLIVFVYVRRPILTGSLTKQAIFLWFLNCFHTKDCNREPMFMLIDDDSGMGIYKIHEICERVGVKATFAVVPAVLDSTRCNSLRSWHKDGYGIALHGYNHGRWKEWTSDEIVNDIIKSIAFLEENNISSSRYLRIVVTPYSYNTHAIRNAIRSQNMKMVMGACVVNPDTTTFQWGRMFITKNTDLGEVRSILKRVKDDKGFIIFATHSSNSEEFSTEKTEAILRLVEEMGFKPY